MKVNIQKLVNRYTSLLVAIVVFVSCLFVPVLGANVGENELVTSKNYASITYDDEEGRVIYNYIFPPEWYRTGVFRAPAWSSKIGDYSGKEFSFMYAGEAISLLMKPCSSNAGVYAVGSELKGGHVIDLSSFPSDATYIGGLRLVVKGQDIVYNADCVIIHYFVDKNGMVIGQYDRQAYPNVFTTDTALNAVYSQEVKLADMNIPSDAVGFIPVYTLKNLTISDDTEITVSYQKYSIHFSMTNLEWEAQQNEKLVDTLNDVKDEILNGSPEQNQQAGEAVDKMDSLGGEIDSFGESMQTTKPDVSTVQIKLDKLVDHPTLLAYVAPIQELWENKTLTSMLIIVATLVIVSWVFFGKKGS